MALKKVLENLDNVDESLKSLYAEKDGKFVLDVEGGFEDVDGLKSALAKERESARKAEQARKEREKELENLGMSTDEIKDLIEKEKDRQSKQDLEKGEFEKLKNQLLEKHQKELGSKDERLSQVYKALEKQMITAEAVRAISKEKGVADLLLPHVQGQVKVEESDNGEFAVRVMGKDGPRYNDKGEFMGIGDLVKEMKENEVFGRAFEGSNISGGGSTGNDAGAGGSEFSISATDARDHQKFKQAEAQAQKAGKTLVIKD